MLLFSITAKKSKMKEGEKGNKIRHLHDTGKFLSENGNIVHYVT